MATTVRRPRRARLRSRLVALVLLVVVPLAALTVVNLFYDRDAAAKRTYDRTTGILDVSGGGRFAVGSPGDWFGVGDWDCDGTRTPALYRPASGEVFLFDAWADGGAVTSATPVADVPDGDPVIRNQDGCDRLVVQPR